MKNKVVIFLLVAYLLISLGCHAADDSLYGKASIEDECSELVQKEDDEGSFIKKRTSFEFIENKPYPDSLYKDITVIKSDWESIEATGSMQRSWHNEKVDFSGFYLSLVCLDIEEKTLSFQVHLPAQWDVELCRCMMEETLRFQIMFDNEETDVFRERRKTLISEDPYIYEIAYKNCVFPKKQWDTVGRLQIIPYCIYCTDLFNAHLWQSVSLEEGETYSFYTTGEQYVWDLNRNYLFGANYTHLLLHELALDIPIHDTPKSPQRKDSMLKTVTIWDEFYEQNYEEGYYSKENQLIPPHGSYCNRQLDFSNVKFTLQRFCLSQTGPEIEVHWQFPTSWSGLETRSARRNLDFVILVDGVELRGPDLTISVNRIPHWPSETNQQDDFSDMFFSLYPTKMSYEKWKNAHEVIIIPEYKFFTEVDSTTLTEDPVIDGGWLNYSSSQVEQLDWLAITIDIDDTIFDDGL